MREFENIKEFFEEFKDVMCIYSLRTSPNLEEVAAIEILEDCEIVKSEPWEKKTQRIKAHDYIIFGTTIKNNITIPAYHNGWYLVLSKNSFKEVCKYYNKTNRWKRSFNNWLFEVTEKGISIVGTTNQNIIDLTIPQTIKGYPVTNIRHGALEGCKNIQSISFYENMNGLFRQIGELFGEHIQTSDEQFYFKQIDLDETRGDPRMFDPYYRIFYIPKTLKVICIQNYPEDSACTKEIKREILTAKAQSEILVIFQNSR